MYVIWEGLHLDPCFKENWITEFKSQKCDISVVFTNKPRCVSRSSLMSWRFVASQWMKMITEILTIYSLTWLWKICSLSSTSNSIFEGYFLWCLSDITRLKMLKHHQSKVTQFRVPPLLLYNAHCSKFIHSFTCFEFT